MTYLEDLGRTLVRANRLGLRYAPQQRDRNSHDSGAKGANSGTVSTENREAATKKVDSRNRDVSELEAKR